MTPPTTILRVAADLQGAAYATWENDPDAFSAAGVQAKRYRIGGNTYVAIRGTDDLLDWLRNVPDKVFCGPTTTFAGYLGAAVLLRSWINSEDIEGKLILCGHSQGGGIAITLPMVSVMLRDKVDHIITFGSPKCTIGPHPCNDKITRVVRRLDVVPDLPTLGGWEHVGAELYFEDDGTPSKRGLLEGIMRRHIRFNSIGFRALSAINWGLVPPAVVARVRQWHSCEGYSACQFGGGE